LVNVEELKYNIESFLYESLEHKNKSIDFILVNHNTNESYVFASDGLEEMIEFTPYSKEMENGYSNVPEWDFNFDTYLFELLEKDFEISYMRDDVHYGIWETLNELYPEDIDYKLGVQKYIDYCVENSITKEYLEEKLQYNYQNLEVKDIMRFYEKDYIEERDNQVIMAKQTYEKQENLSYIKFVLGYDLLQDRLKNSSVKECDINYNFCSFLAEAFIESEEYKNTRYSLYDALVNWLDNNEKFISSEYSKFIDDEKIYNNNMKIIAQGYRENSPIALVEKDLGGEKEYIVAFNFKTENDKLYWGYGYYYDNDNIKATEDFKKVIEGGNLADTFSKKENETERA